MNPRRSPKTWLAASAAALLLMAACGDSADPTTTTVAGDTTTTTVAATSTEPGDTTTTTADTTSTTGDTTTTTPRRTTTTEDGGTTTTTRARSTTSTTELDLDAALAVRAAPLEVELASGLTVTFSEWFFATFNRDATFEVRDADGDVIASGVVTDVDAMEDRGTDGFAFFDASGSLVAQMTQDELLDAANQALVDAGLAP